MRYIILVCYISKILNNNYYLVDINLTYFRLLLMAYNIFENNSCIKKF